ncbi:MAG TPA: DUF6518 family protein [Actinomycetota bacterium]|nr:DUF6518 family protein [Actinomycetota bacterium]
MTTVEIAVERPDRRPLSLVVAAVVGVLFGAGDQYLGSLTPMVALGPWTVSVSQMSALWLLLPFVVGTTQDHPRRAMLAGLTASVAALVGYYLMTVSPMESVPLREAPHALIALLPSNLLWIVGGLIGGPLFGLLGHRWRIERWWPSAALVAGILVLEPLARLGRDQLVGPSWVWGAEAAVGAVLAVGFVAAAGLRRRGAPAVPDSTTVAP